ncbi:bifunctional isocitrate dehydrogenase kinase/phosphatase [Burkholderia territorii]|uniref:bifunctional isocitrate dehydrogenase kinase/phosphatase n=1 Tax=Burkholderia territorii TaxID=1503055 RepID=UPI00075E8F9E|nr:bifunctional isocitrate dehydrogenase kinase/phosphatase [Burkholderia territorii]KVL47033.1 bifunctional isocitrate dehydrogenase kinase/phosphatase [Burkholderia territorii]KVN43044.1 bifunctional isocitrate dehydrogenase kinase/phosphatase [Burkholderia territorii]KVT82286.1 bifunctional isocitrate dehydrogenase kinase/phosphatase [Burkholderia territorii]KWA32999.1 bifunctional isocitrate dehydrogenase kinase/phosphatase [Burkholderia territorii]KWH05415.1 bifunctional isocitrate dehydr
MNHFPKLLSSQIGFDVAQTMLEYFDRHYRIFREAAVDAKTLFERTDWHGLQRLARERITSYDERVKECVEVLEDEYDAENIDDEVWQQIKLHYIGLLTSHRQPECAETFFNSVCCKILHRSYFSNDFIFVRPAISTEYLENDEPAAKPTYRAYYPGTDGLAATLERIVTNFQLEPPFEDLTRDIGCVMQAITDEFGQFDAAANFQIHVLSSLFFRNKSAYIIGRIINADRVLPFAVPIRHVRAGLLALDTVLLRRDQLQIIFSFSHSYFLVDMGVPSAYVDFLCTIMPGKPKAEIYTSVGLQKQGKNLFYRDLLHHLSHSSDRFIIAPGIKGLVMLVFTLPSFPYVFKIIKDHFPPPKETTRAQIMEKYQLVKRHDRLGRMADTLEYSSVALPLSRLDHALVRELEKEVPSLLEYEDDNLVIKHLYIERRMTPLNLYLQNGSDADVEHGVKEYGNAVKELMKANIFPGDMLYKNFGVTRHGRVVFYDYDEIEYLTDCNVRRVPPPRNEEDELSGEPWYTVGPHDIFPETYGPFLLGDPRVRSVFMKHHADFFEPALWQESKDKLLQGELPDFFPYDASLRFSVRYPARFGAKPDAGDDAGDAQRAA